MATAEVLIAVVPYTRHLSSVGVVAGVVIGCPAISVIRCCFVLTTPSAPVSSETDGAGPPSGPPAGARPDPTSPPVASKQAPDTAAYRALAVAGQPAGVSYTDPVTGVKVWKVTSSSVPAPNTGAGHDYADGGNRATIGWGPDNNTHTILIRGDGMAYHLVDFTRGVGFSNYRVLPSAAQPDRDLCFSFSNLATQPRIAYVVHNGVLNRFNSETMLENEKHRSRSGWAAL